MSTLETLMIVFIAVTALAVVVQMIVLAALYVSVKKSSTRMEALANLVETRLIPLSDALQGAIQEYRPKLDTVLTNVTDASTLVKQRIEQVDAGLGEALERSRIQLARVEAVVGHALDRVENASELVQQSVASPVRQATGVLQGLSVGLASFFHKSASPRTQRKAGVPKDNMFV